MGPNDQYPNYYYNSNQPAAHQNDYSGYQQQPPPNPVSTAQQYQHTRTASGATNTHYTNHQPTTQAQGYAGQQVWYGTGAATANADGSQRAAEALRSMGTASDQTRRNAVRSPAAGPQYTASANIAYGANAHSTGAQQGATTATTSQYPSVLLPTQQNNTYSASSNYGATHSHGQQPRPSSVNSVRSNGVAPTRSPVVEGANPRPNSGHYQPQRAQQMANITRGASPAQIQASRHLQSLQADQRATGDQGRSAMQTAPPNAQYDYQANGAPQQSGSQYDQSSTVDPIAVYDPWPEYLRKLEVVKLAKEAQDAKEAAERAENDAKEAEEKRKADEIAKAEEERKRAEAEEMKELGDAKKKTQVKERQKNTKGKAKATTGASASVAPAPDSNAGPAINPQPLNGAAEEDVDPEAQIRALMAMVKKMNDKHPSLLAKVWEQERQQHIEKTTSQSPVATAAAAPSPTPPSAQPSTINTTQGKKKSSLKPVSGANAVSAKVNALNAKPAEKSVQNPGHKPGQKATQQPTRGSTVWPKENKVQLATSAASWLNAFTDNRDRQIKPETIREMLDRNPTYIELCEMLEATGLKLERAAFARALLHCVPDVNASTKQSSAPVSSVDPYKKISRPSASLATQPKATPHLVDPTQTNGSVQGSKPYQSPYFDSTGQSIALQTVTPSVQPSKNSEFRKSESKEPKSASLPVEPTSKAEAARKRTFADIVDLTTLSDDEDLPSAPKMQRFEYSAPSVTLPGQAYQDVPSYLPPSFRGIVPPYLQQGQQQQPQPQPYQSGALPTDQHRFPPPARIVDERLRNVELGKTIDRKKAIRRRGYDISTIGRDVLLATGKHPEMLPLNAHLDPLRTAFPKQIDYYTDLETIRWDLLDPGDPIAPETADSDDRDSVLNDADDEIEDDRPIPPRIVNRTVIGADGQTSTITQVEPGPYHPQIAKRGLTGRPRGKPGRPLGWRKSDSSKNMNEAHRGTPQNQSRPITSDRGGLSTPSSSRAPTSTPGSAPTPAAPGYAAFNQTRLNADGKPVKKKGRPVGWRKSLHMKGVGVYAGGSGIDDTPAKSSSLRKSTNMPSTQSPDVRFAVYECKWKGCQAKLHNLETLRKHLNKLHGKVDEKGRFTCKWENCGKRVQSIDQATGETNMIQQYHYFPDFKLWGEHVEKVHVMPVAWKLGDGPPGGISDSNATDSEAYLSDAHGRRVTPRISVPASATGTPGSAGLAQRGRPPKPTPEQQAKAAQAEVAKKKQEIGPGMDRGGARLVNDKRRAGFVDDEDGQEVIVSDEE